MNEKLVLQTAKSLNKEKYNLEKLNKQIELLKEKEETLKKELVETNSVFQSSKIKEQEIKEINLKIKMQAEDEIIKNKKDHNELTMLREMKKTIQKELNRATQDNLNAKYNLESLKENKKILESNLQNLQDSHQQLTNEKDSLNQELLSYKNEYDELMQLYELKKSEDVQLKTLYKFHFK